MTEATATPAYDPKKRLEAAAAKNQPGQIVTFTNQSGVDRAAIITHRSGDTVATLAVFGAHRGDETCELEFMVPYSSDRAPFSWRLP
jgi:hypothetical protein